MPTENAAIEHKVTPSNGPTPTSPPGSIPCDLTKVDSGYILARMPFTIMLAPEAVEDIKNLKANVRAMVRTALETHPRHEPKKTSRGRIKRLRGLARPQYRLRVGEVRVFYDVSDSTVEVLAIVTKSEAESWLARLKRLE